MTATPKPLAIYIHWPFCASKCPYCDFNSHVRESVDQTAWRDGLLREMAYWAAKLPNRTVGSIFFGGGTPSLMPPQTVEALLNAIARHWTVEPDVEVTLEANPTSSEAARFAALRQAGVNRVSLGVQSLRNDALRFLGRQHSAKEALGAVEMAAGIFPRYSFDLIYARPNLTLTDWEAELREALQYAGTHLSTYQLTIEPGTAFFHAMKRGDLVELDDDACADQFELTQCMLADAGLPAYEISNHAAPGHESRHNLTYWRYGDYVGVGPGAHGRISVTDENAIQQQSKQLQNQEILPEKSQLKTATYTIRSPEKWLDAVNQRGHGLAEMHTIHADDAIAERLLMGLRLHEGIHEAAFEAETGVALRDVLNPQAVTRFRHAGWLAWENGTLRITPTGMVRLDGMLPQLVEPNQALVA